MVYKPPGTSTSSRGISPQRPPHQQKQPATMPSSSSSSSIARAGGQSLVNLNNYRDNATLRGRRWDAFHTNGSVRKVNNGSTAANDSGGGSGMKRSNSLNNKYNNGAQTRRSNSIERMNNGNVYRGRSPLRNSTSNLSSGYGTGAGTGGRNQPVLVRSRGNDIGSMDNLDNITQASTGSSNSMPGTPEDNINVVVRVRPLS
uniref:Kinesin motor domain-containing protein n=1 Tax=Anopheles atroparvus TaxID=41427 RepID=A0AAG5DLD6_ANOAO